MSWGGTEAPRRNVGVGGLLVRCAQSRGEWPGERRTFREGFAEEFGERVEDVSCEVEEVLGVVRLFVGPRVGPRSVDAAEGGGFRALLAFGRGFRKVDDRWGAVDVRKFGNWRWLWIFSGRGREGGGISNPAVCFGCPGIGTGLVGDSIWNAGRRLSLSSSSNMGRCPCAADLNSFAFGEVSPFESLAPSKGAWRLISGVSTSGSSSVITGKGSPQIWLSLCTEFSFVSASLLSPSLRCPILRPSSPCFSQKCNSWRHRNGLVRYIKNVNEAASMPSPSRTISVCSRRHVYRSGRMLA